MEIFRAHYQWANRPQDERFTSLSAMYDACKGYADVAAEKEVPWGDLRVEASGRDLRLIGKAGVPARISHWGFGQLSARAEAPASYMRSLPPTLAAQCVNHGLAKRSDGAATLLFHRNGDLLLRAATSDRYARIWNWEVVERMMNLPGEWRPAQPTFRWDGGQTDPEAPPALYASDHDMFAFLLTDKTVGQEGESLRRGVIVENSEVGARALRLTRFLFREMCGNHIIWGAKDVTDLRIRHVGQVRDRWTRWAVAVREYANESAREEDAVIARAKATRIAATKEQVLDAVFGKRSLGLSRQVIEAGYGAVIPEQDGDPRTVWGLVQGLTRHSQTIPFTDDRTVTDRAAGKLLTVTF